MPVPKVRFFVPRDYDVKGGVRGAGRTECIGGTKAQINDQPSFGLKAPASDGRRMSYYHFISSTRVAEAPSVKGGFRYGAHWKWNDTTKSVKTRWWKQSHDDKIKGSGSFENTLEK